MGKKKLVIEGTPDKRLLQHKLLRGELTDGDIQAYTKQLPDVSDNAEPMSVSLDKSE